MQADKCSLQERIRINGLALLWGCYPQPSEQKLGITLWPPIGRLASVV
jgi:hypothetical protein